MLGEELYDDNAAGYEMWANNPGGDGSGTKQTFDKDSASEIPFDGRSGNPGLPGTIKEWGVDPDVGQYGSITVTGSAGGCVVPIKLIKKG